MRARGLTKIFRLPGGGRLTACEDVSVTLPEGRTVAVVGESGSGKSTLLRMLIGLERPTSGDVLLDGESMIGLSGARLREVRRRVQMVFQDPLGSFAPRMRVAEAICAPLINYGLVARGDVVPRARGMLHGVGLPEHLVTRYPHQLSGGQLQRCAIARALALDPRVLLCDEATSALDVSAQAEIIALLARLQAERGIAIGFVCHDLALVAHFAQTIVVMHHGRVVEQLPAEDLLVRAEHPCTRTLLDSVLDPRTRDG
ncbi:dipeptide/oligopeptide/nickel ABC transporter ATP-binding protein, partial [uncultured Propionibacterium sp.]|uniref:ABC transporter ATP-binding protein n=1 Tax=uncultured Propionibacterium sp. TaxID=218066 RepID=UPI00292E2217